jgi:ATP-dependent DNA helicase RecG
LLEKFEPPARIAIDRVPLCDGKVVVVLQAEATTESVPFTFNGRAYQRVGSTTSVMPQERYESLLLDRAHARRRWENQAAVDVRLEDLDQEEILRTRQAAIERRRISAGTMSDVGDILDRMGLRRNGIITQAAQILYGTRFLPDYPQGLLKMGRFRGTTITGDILDNKQEHMHAFAMVREGMAFLDRTLPLAARFTKGEIFREDRLPVPPDALREILLNAVMHREYSNPGSYVAIAVFDDRIEIRSIGCLPAGVTAESLTGPHLSQLRNPLIADAFHRTGAVEVWGRGTNRVIEECQRYGIEAPTFEEQAGALIVTFKARIGPGVGKGPSMDQVGTKMGLSEEQVGVLVAAQTPQPISALMELCKRANRTKFRDQVVRPLIEAGLLKMTIPTKPTSSRQRYLTTDTGRAVLSKSEASGVLSM